MREKLGRRAFLEGLGLGAVALPFLRLLQPAPARAAGSPKRLIVFHTACGTIMREFWPGADGSFLRILKPLEPMKPKLLVMRGINMESAYKSPVPRDHLPDNNNGLTARQAIGSGIDYRPSGISVDQHIANVVGKDTKFASLQLGVNVGGYCQYISSRGTGLGIFPENSPQKAFDRMFKDALPNADPAELDRLRADKKSVLDVVNAELKELRCALGAEDRPRLEAHVESLRDLERALDTRPTARCAPPTIGAETDFPARVKQQIDVAVAAVACDLTRVVTIQLQNGASGQRYNFITGVPAYSHHGISHNSEGVNAPVADREEWLVKIETWNAQQFLYLAQRLAAIPDPAGTLLDGTAALWSHEQSNGASHSRRDMPYVLAGSCGGAFRTGRVVNIGGKPHNGLLISLANAMGAPTDTFGDPDFSKGPLTDL